MSTAARRGRGQVAPGTVWIITLVALLVHGTVLGTVDALDMRVLGQGMSLRELDPEAVAPLKSNCMGDALLASSARLTMCFAPWRSDVDQCVSDAEMAMYMDLSSCTNTEAPVEVAAISMMPPNAADKVKPIDPEPLLEMMKQQEQPTPKPPELVQQQQQQQQQQPTPAPQQQAIAKQAQIVETVKPTEEKPPENTRFLAEHDTAVKKQQVARGAVNEPMIAKSKPQELTPKENPKEASIKEQLDRPKGTNKDAPDAPGTLSMRKEGAQAPSELQQDAKTRGSSVGATGPLALDGIVPRKGDGAFEQQRRERSELPRGESGAGGGAPDVPNLKPSQDVLERAIGGGSVDHLDDVADGDETALNAKRWIHASFFNRLKRQVAQNWDPASVWRRKDPTGAVYGFKTRVTEVRVSLTSNGQLAKIVVTSPSGVPELDEEAVRAFRDAAPFVNTPKELAKEDGLVTFGFSFYFEIGAPRSSWRVIKSM